MLTEIHKSSKKACLAVALLTGMLLVTGCGGSDKKVAEADQGYPVKWELNLEGQPFKQSVEKAPTHAISMSQATTEMMLALGLAPNMVGTAFLEEEMYPSLVEDYKKVPVLADKWPSYEVFMAAKPDFATGWPSSFSKRAIEANKILPHDVKIWVPESMLTTDADLETNFRDMQTLGKIFHVSEKSDAWVKEQKAKLSAIQEKISNLPHKRIFIYDSEDGQPFTAFEGYTTNILKLIGADNVMSGRGVNKTWAKGSWEDVVAANPDYIIICDYGVSIRNDDDFQGKIEKLKANPQLASITAVKEGNFIRVKLSEITPGVRTVDALQRLAEEIHGIKL